MHFKTAAAGLAQCRESCPAGWLCETRVPDGNGAACGPSPLNLATLVRPTDAMHTLVADSPWGGSVKLCDRANPPAGGAIFEITCFDGGQTGNRYSMVKTALQRAACCGGIALFPPEFDHFPQSGASCFDFRGLRAARTLSSPHPALRPGPASPPSPGLLMASTLRLAPATSRACAANVSANSKRWWGPLMHETGAHCPASGGMDALLRLCASLYAGFAVPGLVFRDTRCAAATGGGGGGGGGGGEGGAVGEGSIGQTHPSPHHQAPRTLTMHVRSGDIFSNWRDGKHLTSHGGFQHDPYSRGQPPLAFYAAAANHSPRDDVNGTLSFLDEYDEDEAEGNVNEGGTTPHTHPVPVPVVPPALQPIAGARHAGATYQAAVLATSPDRSNPVSHALLARSNGTALSAALELPLSLSSSESFQDDLTQLLCARHLVLALSSLNAMLLDSPNLRDAYTFEPSPDGCGPPRPPCAAGEGDKHHGADARVGMRTRGGGWADPALRVRSWCLAPQPSAGIYSVARRWENTEEQAREMVEYARGQMSPPVLQGGGCPEGPTASS